MVDKRIPLFDDPGVQFYVMPDKGCKYAAKCFECPYPICLQDLGYKAINKMLKRFKVIINA